MNVLVTWVPDVASLSPTDVFNVFYKVADSLNLNSWSLANPTPLPSTATSYTITGLEPNTVYRIAVEKSCLGLPSQFISETEVTLVGCPIYAYYQGPVVNGYPTLFYSVSYPQSNNVQVANSILYDITVADYNYLSRCTLPNPCTEVAFPIGRGVRANSSCASCNPPGQTTAFLCGSDYMVFDYPSNLSSGVGYYGVASTPSGGTAISQSCPAGLGTPGLPILLSYGGTYRFALQQGAVGVSPVAPYTFPQYPGPSSTLLDTADCLTATTGTPSVTINNIAPDTSRLSGVLTYNGLTGLVRQVIVDGTNQTAINGNINHYQFTYYVEDNFANVFPLVNSNGQMITTPSISYTRHSPIYISITAAELSAGMTIICKTLNPFPATVVNVTGVDMTGMSVANFCTSIAQLLTAAGYPSDHVFYGGAHYVRFALPDAIYTGAQIEVDGPNVIGGPTSYNGTPYGLLNTYVGGNPWISGDDVISTSLTGNTVGQYKIYTDDFWQMIPGGGVINANINDTIEFVMFDTDIQLYEVENLTTSTVYDLANYSDIGSLPMFNTKNNVRIFSMKCDAVEFSSGDVLEFRFTNPFIINVPFINTAILNF
jgi:hypothetical protein